MIVKCCFDDCICWFDFVWLIFFILSNLKKYIGNRIKINKSILNKSNFYIIFIKYVVSLFVKIILIKVIRIVNILNKVNIIVLLNKDINVINLEFFYIWLINNCCLEYFK